jgi:signal transduction histidine kinase
MIAIVAVLCVLLILILVNQKKQRQFEQRVADMKLDHEKTLLKTQTEIHEQTLRDISREIHDNIHLSLIMAKMNLYDLEEHPDAEIRGRGQISGKLVSNAIEDLSAMSRSLNSDLIRSQGLIKALQSEVERVRRCTKLIVDLNITGEPIYLHCEKELFLFRLVREAFNNVLKHAKAKSVELSLHYNNRALDLNIIDDGEGFDEATVIASGKTMTGLTSMRKRMEFFNGSLRLKTELQKGTELFVTIPY